MDEHIFGPPTARAARLPALYPWKKSTAYRLLQQDLASNVISLSGRTMNAYTVQHMRPEYLQYPQEFFARRLATARKDTIAKNNRNHADASGLIHDRQMYPQPTHDTNGVPRWEGSEAERWLKVDITSNLHIENKPKTLYESRLAYQEFSLDIFRGHIYQEIKRRKFIQSYYGR